MVRRRARNNRALPGITTFKEVGLRAMNLGSARAMQQDQRRGMLKVGLTADLVQLLHAALAAKEDEAWRLTGVMRQGTWL